jgi:hypothetical protein
MQRPMANAVQNHKCTKTVNNVLQRVLCCLMKKPRVKGKDPNLLALENSNNARLAQ